MEIIHNQQTKPSSLYLKLQSLKMLKSINLLTIVALLAVVSSLPFKEKIALHNSLQVGRAEDPNVWGCTGCTEETKPIRSHVIEEKAEDVKAILSVYDDYTVLAFRYTATVKNVWYDLLWAIQVQEEHSPKGCKVQKQFDGMWNSIRDDTYDDLIASAHTGHLIITGISLGGGLASLSFVDIKQAKIFDDIEIITFGAPRVGNKKWAQWFEEYTEFDTMHICLSGDPICVLPRCLTLACNYRHAGIPVTCNTKTGECVEGKKFQEDSLEDLKGLDYERLVNGLAENLYEEWSKDQEEKEEEEFGGIMTHINGYKKMSDYVFISQ